jgi:broad specificity phosphatase PhoE
VRLFVFARHAQSVLNVEQRINGDPSVPSDITDDGRREAEALGLQLAQIPLDLCVHTRFPRTRQTAEAALGARGVPFVEEPLFDDIDVGDLEGQSISDYRAWKREHARSDAFPGGESLDDAGRRYARACRALLERDAASVLVVCHEIPVRYLLNAAAGCDDLDGPVHTLANATPYLFDEVALARGARRIDELVG